MGFLSSFKRAILGHFGEAKDGVKDSAVNIEKIVEGMGSDFKELKDGILVNTKKIQEDIDIITNSAVSLIFPLKTFCVLSSCYVSMEIASKFLTDDNGKMNPALSNNLKTAARRGVAVIIPISFFALENYYRSSLNEEVQKKNIEITKLSLELDKSKNSKQQPQQTTSSYTLVPGTYQKATDKDRLHISSSFEITGYNDIRSKNNPKSKEIITTEEWNGGWGTSTWGDYKLYPISQTEFIECNQRTKYCYRWTKV